MTLGATSIKQAFIKIKKYDTLESNSLSLVESLLWVQWRRGVLLSRVDQGEEKIIGAAT